MPDVGVRSDLGRERPGRVGRTRPWGVVNCGGFGGEIATPMDTDIAMFDKVISVNARARCWSSNTRRNR